MQPSAHPSRWTRRQVLKWGAAGAATTSLGIGSLLRHASPSVSVPPLKTSVPGTGNGIDPLVALRDFDYGTVMWEQGRRIREFRVVANSTPLQLNAAVSFMGWTLNGRIPGPTLRAVEGDRIRIIFDNEDGHSHSMHVHGIHPAAMDGVQAIRHGNSTLYEFEVSPYGIYPYHCHVAPITRHVSKGLYGMLIVDPRRGRPAADELILVLGGYDLNDDDHNELYAFNGIPNVYRDHPIPIYQHQRIRIYLLNMIEFDPVVTFHIHANLFQVFPGGHTRRPSVATDVITLGTAERHILEFSYPYPGQYMFHPHQDHMAEQGCMGLFEVFPTRV